MNQIMWYWKIHTHTHTHTHTLYYDSIRWWTKMMKFFFFLREIMLNKFCFTLKKKQIYDLSVWNKMENSRPEVKFKTLVQRLQKWKTKIVKWSKFFHTALCFMIPWCQVVPPPSNSLCTSWTQTRPRSFAHTPVCTLSLTCSYTHIWGLLSDSNTTCVRRPLAQQDEP